MKKIYYLMAAGILAIAASCQKPQFVEPTAERQGITSLTAFFTSGKYVDKEMGRLVVPEGESPDRYVIPIPWYYPEETDDVTTLYMANVRVRAELAENCRIDPPLTVLDLYQEHSFTYTNAQGESKPIIITGERVKSSTTNMLGMNLLNPETMDVVLEGFVDNDNKCVYLFTIDDISGLVAEVNPWYHASVVDAPPVLDEDGKPTDIYRFDTPQDWNQEQTVTILAHDGVTKGDFKVIKRDPEKIAYGFNAETVKEMFNIDPVSRLGVPSYITPVNSSLAYVGGYLVVSHGDGSTPIYLDGRNGSKLGEIATGGLVVGAVTSDEAGNMLLCNHLETAGTFEIYRTRSVSEVPTLFYSYASELSLPLGAKIKVCGDIDSEARITVSYEGVAGITSASQFVEFTVSGGQVVDAKVYDLASSGISWGSYPENSAGLVPSSAKAGENGWMYASYTINGMQWIRPDLTAAQQIITDDEANAWLLNPNCLESKKFNNANYLTLLVCHHFPAWDKQPSLWVYDIADPSSFTGNYQNSPSLVTYNSWLIYFNATNAADNLTQSSGDVIMAPSSDGFKVYIYYYDHYAGMIGGYSADCVKK
ncbi:MAG: DUF5018 domain-containing protein [Bacteroidales bacterium]|nr:DUF5018 domain-containing protein [Bacteroidales bacterium]